MFNSITWSSLHNNEVPVIIVNVLIKSKYLKLYFYGGNGAIWLFDEWGLVNTIYGVLHHLI